MILITNISLDLSGKKFIEVARKILPLLLITVGFGIIGFVGIICPHVVKRLLGHNHVVSIPMSALTGSLLLLIADTLSRSIAGGTALPVGAITSLLGAPFFLFMLFSKGERK